jgi:phosphodiesterase/alkaline phosphatase D-like protein
MRASSPLTVLFLTTLVLLSTFISITADDRPIQHRIALLPDGMTVSWSTTSPLTTLPTVHYGSDRDSLTTNATGFSAHYNSSTTYFHHVEIHGLKPNTTHYWQVVCDAKQSPVLSFHTQPAMEVEGDGKFSVAIYGDLGIDNSVDTLNLLRRIAHHKQVELFWSATQPLSHKT